MMWQHCTQVCGYMASVLYTVSLLPQIIKVAQTKSVDDISVWFLLLHFSAAVLMFVYAISIGVYPVLINNGANVICCAVLFLLYFKYSPTEPSIHNTM